jgi:sugar phosphate isomerase/epimerase
LFREESVHLAVSTRSLWDQAFPAACLQVQELGFDKIEICFKDSSDQLKMSAVAVFVESEPDIPTFTGLVRYAQLLKVAQLTIESSPRGTPFNSEVDRLRERNAICHHAGIRMSILTRTGTLAEDPHTAVELCRAARGVGITLDPSYFICRPGGVVDFDVTLPHVLHVHLRDTSVNDLQVPAGLGEVDYGRIIAMLRQQNYNRSISVDLLPGTLQGDDRLRELRKLRLLLIAVQRRRLAVQY